MRIRKMPVNAVPMICIVAMFWSSLIMGKSTESIPADSPKTAQVKQLKPQSTCPVMGEPIDKKIYADYNGKRIYVCCAGCVEKVKKNPETYIKKLESMGQSVEIIGNRSTKESKAVTADTSMKVRDMKGMKMSGDTTAKATESGYWTCPMHPEVLKTTSGQCPICGMNLVFKSDKVNIPRADRR